MVNIFWHFVVDFNEGAEIYKYTAKIYEKKNCYFKSIDDTKTQSWKNVSKIESWYEITSLM